MTAGNEIFLNTDALSIFLNLEQIVQEVGFFPVRSVFPTGQEFKDDMDFDFSKKNSDIIGCRQIKF